MSTEQDGFITTSNQLRHEIKNVIRRYGVESDVTVYQALGVLEIVKMDLIEYLQEEPR